MVAGTYYRDGIGLLCWPGCPWLVTWLALAVPAGTHLRLSSHRILPVSPRVSNLYVSRNRDGAVPRSHFCGYPPFKVANVFWKSR